MGKIHAGGFPRQKKGAPTQGRQLGGGEARNHVEAAKQPHYFSPELTHAKLKSV